MRRGWRIDPPAALPALSGRCAKAWLVIWLALALFAVVAQFAGAAFVLHNAFRSNPVFATVGLTSTIGYEGGFTVASATRAGALRGVPEDSRLVAIDGRTLPPDATAWQAAQRIEAAPGPALALALRDPAGRLRRAVVTRAVPAAPPIPLGLRMGVRLAVTAIASLTLLGSAALLVRRRRRDPVAMLIATAFVLIAATVDPPMLLWMNLGLGGVIDVVGAVWWALLCIAIAAFPDGRFTPRVLRWTVLTVPLCALGLLVDAIGDAALTTLAIALPAILLGAQFVRYRRLGSGIERQQIKWAWVGFVAGFLLLGAALTLSLLPVPERLAPRPQALYNLAVVCLFELGFAVMALGLLVSLLRFRLWEVDAVITRSAALAIVSTLIGATWAVSADVMKSMLSAAFGSDHSVLSTAVGAALAVGLFSPTKSVVLSWSKRRFDKAGVRLEALPERLRRWSESEPPRELAMRALGVIEGGLHADGAALLLIEPTGRALLAACDVVDADALARRSLAELRRDARFAVVEQLEDDHGPVATIVLGPRSDGNRYNRAERALLDDLRRPLAEALRAARRRMQSATLGDLEARLARLEARPALG